MSLVQSVVDRLDIDLDERVTVGQLNSQTCVQVAREGGFLLLYSRWRKPDIRWVWMDTDNHSLCWEDDEGRTTKIWFSRVKRVSSGSRSAFFRALDPAVLEAAANSAGGGVRGHSRVRKLVLCGAVQADPTASGIDYKKQAFEISLFKRMGAIKRHYRFIAHDTRECHTWLAALAVCWNAASATKMEVVGPLSGTDTKRLRGETAFEVHKSFWHDQVKINKESTCRFISLVRLVQVLQLPCDLRYLQQLFVEHDIHASGYLSEGEFQSLMFQLLNVQWLRTAFRLPPADTLSADVIKTSLTDFQLETAARVQVLIDQVAESNSYNASDNKNLTYVGFNALLKHVDNSLLDLVLVEGHGKLDLPLDRYWIRATYNPFGGGRHKTQSDVALAIADTIDQGYRCFVIDIMPGHRLTGPVIRPNDCSDLELTINKFCYIVTSCAFLKETLPVIILLNLHPTTDPEFYRAAAGAFEKELAGALFKISPGEDFPTLHIVRRKILLGFFPEVLEDYFAPPDARSDMGYQRMFLPPGSASPVTDELLAALAPMFECCSMVFSKHGLKQSERYRVLTSCDFVREWPLRAGLRLEEEDSEAESAYTYRSDRASSRKLIAPGAADATVRQRFTAPLIGSWLHGPGTLTCLATQRQPVVGVDFEMYFSGVQIVCENRNETSYVGRALFPTTEAFVPLAAACVPTVLTIDVLQGYMLPNPCLGAAAGSFAPYVEVLYYGYGQNAQEMHRSPDGTVDPTTKASSHTSLHQASIFDDLAARGNLKIIHRFRSKTVVAADLTPDFGLSTTVALANENAAVMVVLVRNDLDGGGPILASNSFRVSWLRTGIRWMPLRDAHNQQLMPWAGLWLRVHKSTKARPRPDRKKRP